ncbi:Protein of unknown function [Jatrophihabitans endophyticus]|uniref:ABC-2 type transporter transmembrane domain-containing protein n=1 Tax=Jatrophihabitans endophyticus TaxID=1206085 RepID=A0A1M5M1X4_9ACTN|nr:ABC transporter permease [Jatrophihabitans endophyticus]SHG71190.1 Protein of unknown function [Jatrophihabitans endophyticus]
MAVRTVRTELRDAVTPRAFALVVGVLLLQLGFVLSYVGAFHHPTPHRVQVALVAPAQQAPALARALDGLAGQPLAVHVVAGEAAAREQVRDGDASAALVVSPDSTTDRLLVASGGGSGVVTAVEDVVARVEQAQQRSVTTADIVPLQAGDARGLTGFYLVVGWMVGGYLVASLLGVANGSRPATRRRAAIRLGALVPYAILSGLGGAIIVGPVLGALDGHLLALWGLGTLVVLAAGTATIALQALFGVLGIGAAVALFVVLGNPSAGGAFQPDLLPAFWRVIGTALPNGAGTDAVRRIAYFDGAGIGGHLAVLVAWAVLGVVVALLGARTRDRHAA